MEATKCRIMLYIPTDEDHQHGVTPGDPLPAIVVGVNDDTTVNLTVFTAAGTTILKTNVKHDPTPKGGGYIWPSLAENHLISVPRIDPHVGPESLTAYDGVTNTPPVTGAGTTTGVTAGTEPASTTETPQQQEVVGVQ